MIRPRAHSASLVSRIAPSTSSTITSRLPRAQPLRSFSGAIAPVNVALPSRDDDLTENRCGAGRTTKATRGHVTMPVAATRQVRQPTRGTRLRADRSPIPAGRRITPGTSGPGARRGLAAAPRTARPRAAPPPSGCMSGRQADRPVPRVLVPGGRPGLAQQALPPRDRAPGAREADERVRPAHDEYRWPGRTPVPEEYEAAAARCVDNRLAGGHRRRHSGNRSPSADC